MSRAKHVSEIELFEQVAESLIDDALREAAEEYQKRIVSNHFKPGNQQRYGWPEVGERYRIEKARKGYPSQQLVASGKLRDSVVGRGRVTQAGEGRYIIRFDVPKYGEYQYYGASPQKSARNFLDPDEKDQKEFESVAQRAIDKKIQEKKRNLR